MLRVRDLRVIKAGKTICSVPELDVEAGEHVAVIGPNASGKTTFLRVISGLENDFTGECQIDVPKGQRIYVHQSPHLFRGSILFNTKYGLAARRVPAQKQTSTARQWLTTFGVGHLDRCRSEHLSGGERRRVALARAFAVQPDLLILDEPLADLDSAGISLVCRVIDTTSRSTILISSPVPLPKELPIRSYFLEK